MATMDHLRAAPARRRGRVSEVEVVAVGSWRVLAVVLLAAFAALWGLLYVVSEQVGSVLMAIFIVGSGLSVNRVAAYRRRRSGADRPDSIERESATAAASATLQVALVAMTVVGAYATITRAWGVALVTLVALLVVLATYWLSYASARARY